jgi:hypothetical protein
MRLIGPAGEPGASHQRHARGRRSAETMTGADYQRRYAIPHDQVQAILRKHGLLGPAATGG